MKKLLVVSLITISTAAFAAPPTAFTFVAPASVAAAPPLTSLLGVVNAGAAASEAGATKVNAVGWAANAVVEIVISDTTSSFFIFLIP